ncbi:hypothetical protein BLA60_06980 [Actinophytocola xinjiangensis]|uniref:Uncharacterized protein n=1 Tax=Actinophytocola xinjiangensis TaxID=485602 RepID=A0A7Z1B0T6_9PSEU|nr:hypothetical protein [Actinophytocola xinjiangensis]OLF12984.1 hypothetical protein BLA60_06980 [Actinophytocola xinjiangensis]
MGWFRRKCPIDAEVGTWIEESFAWFRKEFGDDPLHADPLLPTPAVIPRDYSGTADEVRTLFDALRERLSVDPSVVRLTFQDEDLAALISTVGVTRPPVECYRREQGLVLVQVDSYYAADPFRIVARLAHQLAHVRLLGEERVTTRRRDHEQLADLLTVYYGAGVFSVNASFEARSIIQFTDRDNPNRAGQYVNVFPQYIDVRRQIDRIGFLSEPQFCYALACYAWLREEGWPDWASHLQRDPANSLNDGLRYLDDTARPGELP